MSTAHDTALSAAYAGVDDVHIAVDVADGEFVIACVGCHAAHILINGPVCSVDGEVLNVGTCGDDAEETEEILFCSGVEVLDGVTLAVEVSLVGSTAGSPGIAPVSDRCPCNLGFRWVGSFGHHVGKVDVGCQNGIGIEEALVHLHLEPCELAGIGNLVVAIGIGREEVFVEESAVVAEAINRVVVILGGF